MNRTLPLAAIAAVLLASPLRAQLAAPADLPPIPGVAAYAHWGQIERSYDDDEGGTSIALSLPFDDKQRGAFVRHGLTRGVELSAGFVFKGHVMTAYPDIVTMLLKVKRPTDVALRGEREGSQDIAFDLGGGQQLVVPAPLVGRTGFDVVDSRPRQVEDTYVIVLTLSQFLKLVDAPTVSAQLHDLKLEWTGGPLEGLRDLASRLTP